MSLSLADTVGKVRPSKTLAVAAKARELREQGIDVINFSAGEPDFDTPQNIKDAAVKALQAGQTKYTAAGGTPELKKAVQAKLQRENGLTYTASQIIVNAGAKHTLFTLFQALLNDGDEVLIPAPYWVSYPDMVTLLRGKPIIIPTEAENNFEITVEDLQKYLTPRTKVLVLNSPANPTGSVYSQEKLQALADFLVDKNLYIVSDEIYEHFLYDGARFHSIAQLSEKIRAQTIVVNGVSKAYSMTGWRIGYAAGPENVLKAMTVIQSQSLSNPTSIAQAAAVEALNGSQSAVDKMLKAFQERRDYMCQFLLTIPGITCRCPQGAFYAFPDVSALYGKSCQGRKINNSEDLAELLLTAAHLAVVPGSGFGADNYIRLSYASSLENIRQGLARLKDFAAALI
ncbi:aspartate aminotransferase [Candidatus Termititenax persephonae]|uniref:Aminotransferase n=1 Tax=Candidatus Termititenax persephonae TaxID=2218525 RepID=A0A388TFU5_9BACT|nr:aspartate aminotransferase [Candidatus Termititenax persephonae]